MRAAGTSMRGAGWSRRAGCSGGEQWAVWPAGARPARLQDGGRGGRRHTAVTAAARRLRLPTASGNYSGMLACFFVGLVSCLSWKSSRSSQITRRVSRGLRIPSTKPRSAAMMGLANFSS